MADVATMGRWNMEVIGVIVSGATALIGIAVSIALYRRQTGNADAKAYRSPIAETIAEVDKGTDPFAVLSRRKGAIESAATLYRPTLPTKRAMKLDAAMAKFQHVCVTVQPGLLSFYESQATGRPAADPKPQVTAALHELLAVAA